MEGGAGDTAVPSQPLCRTLACLVLLVACPVRGAGLKVEVEGLPAEQRQGLLHATARIEQFGTLIGDYNLRLRAWLQVCLDQLGLGFRDQLEHVHDRRDRAEGLLVAMPMQQDLLARRPQLERKATGLDFLGDELLEQQGLLGHGERLVAQAQHQRLVAQREQA